MRGLVKKSTSGDARGRMISVGETPGIRGRPQERATGLLIWEAPGRILCGPGGIFWNPYVRDPMDGILQRDFIGPGGIFMEQRLE